MAEEGKKIIHERIAKYHIDCDYAPGYLSVADRKHQLRYIEEFADYRARWGYAHKMTILSKQDLANHIGSDRYLGGITDPGDGHLHPLNLMAGEAKAAAALGVNIFEQTRVNKIDYGSTVTLHTNQGRVLAKQVALCGNCDLGKTVPSLQSKIMPAGTYIIATESLGETRARQLLPTNAAVCDLNYVLDYFRTTKDHRLLFGGLVAYTGKEPANFPERLHKSMLKTFPQLADVKIDYAWGGNIDLSVTRMPHLGRVSDNVYYMQGFSGHGVVPTRIAGRVMAEVLAGQSQRFDIWNKLKHHAFPGGQLLRFPALLLGTTWFRIRDILG
jgi:gamma-glutamylputrescine oxidase